MTEDPVARGPAPQSPFMSASEVLTWIAFGIPEKHAWKDHALDRLLVALPSVNTYEAIDLLLQAAALHEHDTPELQAAFVELRREGDRREALRQAAYTLIGVIGRNRICFYGIKDEHGVQNEHEQISSTLFMDPSVTITLHDRVQQGADLLKEGINGKPGYRHVQFATDEVLAIWPAEDRANLAVTAPRMVGRDERRRTGTAGRPSSKDLAAAEMRHRAARGDLAHTLAEEARQLCAWLVAEHPGEPPLLPKSLTDPIRAEYRQLKSAENHRPK